MARNPKVGKKRTQDRKPGPGAATGRPRRGRPKICIFCAEHATWVDYKDVNLLRRFVNDRGRIKSRGATGTCAQHQRDVATAIKTARELAMLPYSVRSSSLDTRGGRGGGRRGPAATAGDAAPAAAAEADDATPDAADDLVEADAVAED